MMQIILTSEDLARLSAGARDEILARLFGLEPEVPSTAALDDPAYEGIDMTSVAHLSYREIRRWMEAASDKTKAGLLVFAERHGVVRARDLTAAGIDNLAHFQSRTTIRTRTITGDRDAFLLGWDDWYKVDEGEGRYAVTPKTCRSLRRYFGLS